MSMLPEQTRLILNERVLAFPYGQYTPESALQEAFDRGRMSALQGVDTNPFVHSNRAQGAETVAWLRGHYLASKTVVLRQAA